MKWNRNYGRLTPDPGVVKHARCGVCGEKMMVERNMLIYTSFAGALAKRKHRCDRFQCIYQSTPWHQLAVDLMHEVQDTKSRKIRALLKKEIKKILRKRKAH